MPRRKPQHWSLTPAIGAASLLVWLMRLALVTSAALPATLLWLILACLFKKILARLPHALQQLAGILLGALVGLYGCAMLAWSGLQQPAPWWGSVFAGATLAAVLVAALVLRAKGRAPATTTARLAELQARIRPHFLFNTLNSLSALVLTNRTQAAEKMIQTLSTFYRRSLADDPTSDVPLREEFALQKLYLEIESVRFPQRLRTVYDLPPELEDARIPGMILQPLVENAIKYAVAPQESGAEITISTQLIGQNLRITVSDTGPGLQTDDADNRLSGVSFDGGEQVSTGVGLANIRDRLAQAYGTTHRFETYEPPEGGFAVTIEIPFARREAPPPPDARRSFAPATA